LRFRTPLVRAVLLLGKPETERLPKVFLPLLRLMSPLKPFGDASCQHPLVKEVRKLAPAITPMLTSHVLAACDSALPATAAWAPAQTGVDADGLLTSANGVNDMNALLLSTSFEDQGYGGGPLISARKSEVDMAPGVQGFTIIPADPLVRRADQYNGGGQSCRIAAVDAELRSRNVEHVAYTAYLVEATQEVCVLSLMIPFHDYQCVMDI
jgi:hypothetical protein